MFEKLTQEELQTLSAKLWSAAQKFNNNRSETDGYSVWVETLDAYETAVSFHPTPGMAIRSEW